jgi:2-keto-4-pentenoate hydratase
MDPRRAAAAIAHHRRAIERLPPLGPEAPANLDDAYEVQALLHRELAPRLGPRTGFKIGCTTPVMQAYLGIPSPCAGGLFAATTHASGVALAPSGFVHVGIECEIAARLGRDLPPGLAPFDAEDVAPAVAGYLPAIEIVDDRYQDWRTIGTPTLVADDFFAAGCVLGGAIPAEGAPDLAATVGRTFVNGSAVGEGRGSDVMGHPHNALAWLANHLAARGAGLREGEIVLTGSLVQTVWLNPGDHVMVEVAGLGEVEMTLFA